MLTNEISTSNEFTPKRKVVRSELDDPFYSEENIARLKNPLSNLNAVKSWRKLLTN